MDSNDFLSSPIGKFGLIVYVGLMIIALISYVIKKNETINVDKNYAEDIGNNDTKDVSTRKLVSIGVFLIAIMLIAVSLPNWDNNLKKYSDIDSGIIIEKIASASKEDLESANDKKYYLIIEVGEYKRGSSSTESGIKRRYEVSKDIYDENDIGDYIDLKKYDESS